MTNEIIFITQIASIVSFVVVLFVLYRVLVSQKDATIELLKEKNNFLQDKLNITEKNTPDKLAKNLSQRINILHEEMERLSIDQEKNKDIIKQKEKELQSTQEDLERLEEQLEEIQDIASEYFCPHCKARMEVREYHTESYEYGDIDHEFISFKCGYEIVDGKENSPCKYKKES